MAKKKYKKGSVKQPTTKKAKQIKKTTTVKKPISKTHLIGYAFIALTSCYIIAAILPNFGYAVLIDQSSMLNYGWLGMIGISSFLLIWNNRQHITDTSTNSNNIPVGLLEKKYPKIVKIPILGRLTDYFYHQGIWVNLGLLALIVIGAVIYFYNLGYYNWLPDEPLVVKTARGYLESGTFYKWDYWTNTLTNEPYPRAWPHTWLVAVAIKLFGSSEVTARMISCFFGLLTIPILYFVSNFILKNRLAALVITACLVFHPYTVHYFRRVRMYAVLIPIFLLLFYYCYQVITSKKDYSNNFFNKYPGLKDYLNFHWGFILIALVLLYLNYEIHKISLVILPALLAFYMYSLITKREKRLILLLLIALIPAIYLIVKENVWGMFVNEVGNNQVYNPLYWQFLFKYPVTIALSLLMVLMSIVWSIFSRQRDPIIAALTLVATGIILYVYVIDFNDHYRYVIHLIPFCLILSMGMMVKINNLIPNKILRSALPIIIVLASISEYRAQFDRVYYENIEAQFPAKAYPTIVKNIKPESEALFGMIFQDYYMSGKADQIRFVEMEKNKGYTVNKFLQDSRRYKASWVTWSTRKSRHIDPDFYQYLASNCIKYHGYGVDETLTEVFYCRK